MYKWKRGTALVTAVVAAFGAGFMLAPAASAATLSATIELSQDDIDYYYSVAERFGVPAAVQESLLEKVKAGIPLDSSTGVAPVSTVTTEVDGFERTVETFPDGSVIGTDIEIPQVIEDGVSARGVAGCVTGASAGVYYGQDCWVYSSSLTMGASFYASYSQWSTGSSVWNWHTPEVNIVGGTVSNQVWSHATGTNSSITLKWNSHIGGIVTVGTWLRLNASPGGISQTRGGTW